MLKKKSLHRDMADVNVYTARRLKDMAMSLSGLAQAFADEIGGGRQLTKDDGLAAMQTAAAAVCGDCVRCNLYSGSKREDSYYLYYLLRAFEQKGKIDMEDMPRLFNEACRRKDDYVLHLNRNLGRATMNLSWKNRFLESRDTVIVQFRELASILEEFSGQMENATDITGDWEEQIKYIFRRHHMKVENMLMLEYENEQKEAFLTVRSTNGRCMTARDAADLVGRAMSGRKWSPAKDSKSIITRNAATFRFVEEGKYRMLHGVAKAAKGGELISGDNFTIHEGLPRQVIMSLSDGMGSGPSGKRGQQQGGGADTAASGDRIFRPFGAQTGQYGAFTGRHGTESGNAGFVLRGFVYGVLEAMKLGAVPTFIVGHDGVEVPGSGGCADGCGKDRGTGTPVAENVG